MCLFFLLNFLNDCVVFMFVLNCRFCTQCTKPRICGNSSIATSLNSFSAYQVDSLFHCNFAYRLWLCIHFKYLNITRAKIFHHNRKYIQWSVCLIESEFFQRLQRAAIYSENCVYECCLGRLYLTRVHDNMVMTILMCALCNSNGHINDGNAYNCHIDSDGIFALDRLFQFIVIMTEPTHNSIPFNFMDMDFGWHYDGSHNDGDIDAKHSTNTLNVSFHAKF